MATKETKTKETKTKEPKTVKQTKLTYEAVFNVGNYQVIRLGGEYTIPAGMSSEEAYRQIDAELRNTAALIIEDRKPKIEQPAEQQAEQPVAEQQTDTRIVVEDSDKKQIEHIGSLLVGKVQRDGMSVEDVMENVKKYYNVSDKVLRFWSKTLEMVQKFS